MFLLSIALSCSYQNLFDTPSFEDGFEFAAAIGEDCYLTEQPCENSSNSYYLNLMRESSNGSVTIELDRLIEYSYKFEKSKESLAKVYKYVYPRFYYSGPSNNYISIHFTPVIWQEVIYDDDDIIDIQIPETFVENNEYVYEGWGTSWIEKSSDNEIRLSHCFDNDPSCEKVVVSDFRTEYLQDKNTINIFNRHVFPDSFPIKEIELNYTFDDGDCTLDYTVLPNLDTTDPNFVYFDWGRLSDGFSQDIPCVGKVFPLYPGRTQSIYWGDYF